MQRFLDLSHIIEHGLTTYRGLPAPIISDYLSRDASKAHYAAGTTFHIGKLEMVANTGTYLDSPFHRYAAGKDISQLDLACLANLDGIVVNAMSAGRAIDRGVFGDSKLSGRAVLIRTGWDQHWSSDQYFSGHPFLTKEAAQHLRDSRATLVGIDSYNIDDTSNGMRPAHSLLLGAEIPIVEHLCNLASLPPEGFKFYAVPAKVKGLGTLPVRAFAVFEDGA